MNLDAQGVGEERGQIEEPDQIEELRGADDGSADRVGIDGDAQVRSA
ncbi:hypothetical protein [Actinomadura sp. 6N118]